MTSTAQYARRRKFQRAAIDDYHRPRLPPEYRHALVRDLTRRCKALVYPDGLPGLARSLHRMRLGESIQLQDRLQRIAGEDEPRPGVLVYARDLDRWSYRCLGWAWLDGHGFETLRDALAAAEFDG